VRHAPYVISHGITPDVGYIYSKDSTGVHLLSSHHTGSRSAFANLITNVHTQVVYNPNDATVFLPRLLPALEKATQTIPDPEARAIVEEAHEAMIKLGADGAANAPTHLLEHDVSH